MYVGGTPDHRDAFRNVGAKFGDAFKGFNVMMGASTYESVADGFSKFGSRKLTTPECSLSVSLAAPELNAETFSKLQEDVAESAQIKYKILKLQRLRDNLWTSAEVAMAELALEMLAEMSVPQTNEESTSPAEHRFCKKSLYCFSRTNRLRRRAIWITQDWPWFDRLVLILIAANTLLLAMSGSVNWYAVGGDFYENLQHSAELYFNIAFTLECFLKVLAMGFILDEGSYLRDPWNWVDFTVVFTGIEALDVISNV
jgi:hypothetical protein